VDPSVAISEFDEGSVLVAFASPADVDDDAANCAALAVLSDDEIRRAKRFRFGQDRRAFVASRALVRRSLSRRANVDPIDWRFETSAYGRPFVVFPDKARMLRFSASRTDGLAMCAVATGRDIGADIERLRDCPLDVIEALASTEAQAVRKRSGAARAGRFYSYWTLKESYAKARGLGLTIPFNRFAFEFARSPSR
jgi:4'-phosphopantetheinyl transferase